ncbi:MAG: hypothetical protein ACUVUG_05115 [Candidatus Aminicenantia bacterium]
MKWLIFSLPVKIMEIYPIPWWRINQNAPKINLVMDTTPKDIGYAKYEMEFNSKLKENTVLFFWSHYKNFAVCIFRFEAKDKRNFFSHDKFKYRLINSDFMLLLL